MSNETCILTTRCFTILEAMRDRLIGHDDPLAPILKKKIDSAIVTFRDDVPADVATLNSRVTFRVNDRQPDTRIISTQRAATPVGMFLPVTTLRGLALLGLAEGQEFVLTNGDDRERILLEKVLYQPEAARREKEVKEKLGVPEQRRPTLRVVGGNPQIGAGPVSRQHPDDPGPSAA